MCITTFHINPYKIVTIGKNKFTNQHFYVKIKGPIVQIFFMGYSKLYCAFLDLKKVVISPCFNVTIYIEFEFLDLKKVVIFTCFNVTIYIEFEFLNLKKIVIFTCFNVTIYIEFEFLNLKKIVIFTCFNVTIYIEFELNY
jgi:hypothetical protein